MQIRTGSSSCLLPSSLLAFKPGQKLDRCLRFPIQAKAPPERAPHFWPGPRRSAWFAQPSCRRGSQPAPSPGSAASRCWHALANRPTGRSRGFFWVSATHPALGANALVCRNRPIRGLNHGAALLQQVPGDRPCFRKADRYLTDPWSWLPFRGSLAPGGLSSWAGGRC